LLTPYLSERTSELPFLSLLLPLAIVYTSLILTHHNTSKMQQDIRTPHGFLTASRIQLGAGTTFLPGKKDESVKELIDHVLEHGYVILPRLFSESLVEEAKIEVGRLEKVESEGRSREGGRNGFEGFRTRRVSYFLLFRSPAPSPWFIIWGL
jgi:hypothetical protein